MRNDVSRRDIQLNRVTNFEAHDVTHRCSDLEIRLTIIPCFAPYLREV